MNNIDQVLKNMTGKDLFSYFDKKFEKLETKFETKVDKLSEKVEDLRLVVNKLPSQEAFNDYKRHIAAEDKILLEKVSEVSSQVGIMTTEINSLKEKTRDEKTFKTDVLSVVSEFRERNEKWFTSKVGLLTSALFLTGILVGAVRWWDSTHQPIQSYPVLEQSTKQQVNLN